MINNGGVLLEAYRKYHDIKISDLLNENDRQLCNRKSYTKLISKDEKANELILNKILNNLGFSVFNVDNNIIPDQLWHYIDYYDTNNIDLLLKDIKETSTNFYEYMTIKVLVIIHNYYINRQKLNDKEIVLMFSIIDCFNDTLKKSIANVLGYTFFETETISKEDLIAMLESFDEVTIRQRVMVYYVMIDNHYIAMTYLIKLEDKVNKENPAQYLEHLQVKMNLYEKSNMDCTKIENEIIEYVDEYRSDISPSKLQQVYANLGASSLLRGNYQDAIDRYTVGINIEGKVKISKYIYLIFCYQQLSLEVPKEFYELKLNSRYNEESIALYSYLREKHLRNNLDNRNYLLAVTKIVTKTSPMFFMIIRKEMMELTDEAKSNADYKRMEKIIAKICE